MSKNQEMGTSRKYDRDVEHPTDILFGIVSDWLSRKETIHYFVRETK